MEGTLLEGIKSTASDVNTDKSESEFGNTKI